MMQTAIDSDKRGREGSKEVKKKQRRMSAEEIRTVETNV